MVRIIYIFHLNSIATWSTHDVQNKSQVWQRFAGLYIVSTVIMQLFEEETSITA